MISADSSNKIITAVQAIKVNQCETIHHGVLMYEGSIVGVRVILDKVFASAVLYITKGSKLSHRFFDINAKNCQVAFDFSLEGINANLIEDLQFKFVSKGMAKYDMVLDEKRSALVCYADGKDILEIDNPKLKTAILKSILREC